ncbi:Ribonuclease [Phytophthora megakarya]|uniref:Ribonuclease n=1 Tax=Phytophthora megakarya TaxID=4795 RepID=A0A225ULR7_9STRA|nr:Ribonuclease [Phytophthora megakarya]
MHHLTEPLLFQFNFVVLFYGGSRGNPGPGGAGSLLISITSGNSSRQALWMSSMSLASQLTTNNVAENRGLHAV